MSLLTRVLGRPLALLLVALGLVAVTLPAHAASSGGKPGQTIAPPNNLAGTVSSSGGTFTGAFVEAYMWDPVGEFFDYADSTSVTAAAPGFAFTVQPGSYYLVAYDDDGNFENAYSGGATQSPTGTGSAGVVTVDDATVTTADVTFTQLAGGEVTAQGSVTNAALTALAGATVTSYDWDGNSWSQYDSTTTLANGTYVVAVPDNATVTFRYSRAGSTTQYLGGGATLPATPSAGNSRTTTTTAITLPSVALQPFASQLGTVAGQNLDYCRANPLPANDDSSSPAVAVPFALKFFGDAYTQIYVNNNGNVTFGSALSSYTPTSLNGPTSRPIIAPFFADVDTGGAGSSVVTYGASPDGKTFCVNWADVGYFSEHDEKLNTVQLLLSDRSSSAGRSPGDFDITFNYDHIAWETGDASNGVDGLGGTSAAVGYSAGTGVTGTFVQLPGSFVNGALLNGGPNALVANSQNSSQVGRYVFQVRNDGLVSSLGSMSGTVQTTGGAPVVDAYVQACPSGGTSCSYTQTGGNGAYSFTGILTGSYAISVWPPDDTLFAGGATATVASGVTTTVPPIVLSAPQPMPANVTLTNNGVGTNGVPSVYYGDPLQFAVDGCAGLASPTYTVTLADGTVLRDHLPMTESPAGHYTAVIAPFYPQHGDARFTTTIPTTCGGSLVSFNVYIDPSGVVTDQYGRPIVGAKVTLSRSDTSNGSFTTVPDGSDIMSASNRQNPDFTDDVGFFRWDVTAGWYRVTAEAAGCGTVTTTAMEVPPEKIDLLIKLTCTQAAPVATALPSLTGTAQVGKTLTAVGGGWPAPLVTGAPSVLRNGVAVGTSYTLLAGDAGASFVARSIGQRPDYVTEGGSGSTVVFTGVAATSAAVVGQAASPVVPPVTPPTTPPVVPPVTPPAVTKAVSTTTAQLSTKKARARAKVKVTVTITTGSGGSRAGTVKVYDGTTLLKTVAVNATGKVVVKLKKLKKGKHKIKATFAGNGTTLGSASKVATLKMT